MFVLAVAAIGYYLIVRLCYKTQQSLIESASTKITNAMAIAQKVQLCIIFGMGIAELLYVASVRFYSTMVCS